MRCRIPDTAVYLGDERDCAAVDGSWAVVHAGDPCWTARCGGGCGDAFEEDRNRLWLNLPADLHPARLLEIVPKFLRFARGILDDGMTLLIHDADVPWAPLLGLLVCAKVLYRVRKSRFEDAREEFETLVGEPVDLPHDGWLLQNWRALDIEPRAQPPEQPSAGGFNFDLPPEEAMALVRAHPLMHFALFTEIKVKSGEWRRPEEPNVLQYRIAAAYDFCQQHGIPCRLVILKPRQVGCSTFCISLLGHHVRRNRCDAMIMGDVAKRTEKMWTMMQGMLDHDSFPWESVVTKSNTLAIDITFPDGEKGTIEHDTAMDPKAGIGGTRQAIVWTEVGRYLKTNNRDKQVMSASMISLANVPESLGIMESTAEGAMGVFFETFKNAIRYEERAAFKKDSAGNLLIGNGFISVFAAWHEFPEYRLPRKSQHAEFFDEHLDERERRGMSRFGWTMEQVAWRRQTIKRECGGDPRKFDEDFPDEPDAAFLASGRPRFDPNVLAAMEEVAGANYHLEEKRGCLDRQKDGSVTFRYAPEGEAWLWVSKKPQYGRTYIGSVDPCTGEQNEGSPFPDAHAAHIWCEGYHEKNVWHPPELVAVIHEELGCRYDDGLLSERMKRLLDWYGNPMVVCETGNGLGALGELRREGCTLYQREKEDAQFPGKKLQVAGWETNRSTRPLLINELANYIRSWTPSEPTITIHYLPLIWELKTFIINDRGKAEAKHGSHDDHVMSACMALYNLDGGSMLMPQSGGPWGGGSDGPASLFPVLGGGLAAGALS